MSPRVDPEERDVPLNSQLAGPAASVAVGEANAGLSTRGGSIANPPPPQKKKMVCFVVSS